MLNPEFGISETSQAILDFYNAKRRFRNLNSNLIPNQIRANGSLPQDTAHTSPLLRE